MVVALAEQVHHDFTHFGTSCP